MVESVRWMSGSDDSEMTSAPDARPESESFGIRSVRLPLRCVGGGRRSTVSLIVSRSGDLAITLVTLRATPSTVEILAVDGDDQVAGHQAG